MSAAGPTYVGRPHDFDFLCGRWHVVNRRLRRRLAGCETWDTFDARHRGVSLLDGILSVDEMRASHMAGSAVRLLDLTQRRWSIHWVTGEGGVLLPPVHGGWCGDRGEFHGDDTDEGRPVRVRFVWQRFGRDAARWTQAFAPAEAPEAWEDNWVMDFSRVGD
jgi:hypothetical protein